MKKVWKIVKNVLLGFIVVAIGIILFRVFVVYSDESVLRDLKIDDTLRTVYAALPEEGRSYFAKTHDVPYQISEPDGYFKAYAFVWIPEARQVQIVVRYNKNLPEKLGLGENGTLSFRLANGTSGETVSPSAFFREEKWMYQYVRLVFDSADVNDEDDLWIEMTADGSDEPVNRLVCHYALQKSSVRFYRLNASELRELEED